MEKPGENIFLNKDCKFSYDFHVIQDFLHTFLMDGTDKAVNLAIQMMGEIYDVSRIYIFEDNFNHTHCSNTYEWRNKGIKSEIDNLQFVSYAEDLKGKYKDLFDNEGIIIVNDIRKLPKVIYDFLVPQGVISMLHCAMYDGDEFVGFIGFDECRRNREWTKEEIGTLLMASRIIGLFIAKKHKTNLANFSSEYLRAFEDNGSYIYIVNPKDYIITYNNKKIVDLTKSSGVGKKCYNFFARRNEPCDECPLKKQSNFSNTKTVLKNLTNANLTLFLSASSIDINHNEHYIITGIDVTEFNKSLDIERTLYQNSLTFNADIIIFANITRDLIIQNPIIRNFRQHKYKPLCDRCDSLNEILKTIKGLEPLGLISVLSDEIPSVDSIIQAYKDGKRVLEVVYFKNDISRYRKMTIYMDFDDENNCLMASVLIKDETQKYLEKNEEERLLIERSRWFEAFSNIFNVIYRYDLVNNLSFEIKTTPYIKSYMPSIVSISKAIEGFEKNDLTEIVYEQNKDFWDFTTLNERMKGCDLISRDIQTINSGWVKLTVIAYKRDDEGNLLEILWTSRDINSEKNIEREMNEVKKAIVGTYSTAFIADCINGTYKKIYCDTNSLDNKITGNLEGRIEGIKDFIDPKYIDSVNDFYNMDTIDERLKNSPLISIDFLDINGEWYRNSMIPVEYDSNGRIIKIMCGRQKIDEQKRFELEQQRNLELAKEEAQRANEAKSKFLLNMSHDIRTPMNAILGFSTIALDSIDNKKYVLDCLNKIIISGRHLQNLINDILDMSSIEVGKTIIKEDKCSIAKAIHSIIPIIQSQAKSKQIYFDVYNINVKDEYVYADELKINQVLINLLGNSIKFTKPNGKITLSIEQCNDVVDGYAKYRFVIKDTGIGMSKEFIKKMYDPFEREGRSNINREGTGLGLSIVKSIIDLMKGTIEVESELGVGSKFTITLDLRVQEDINNLNKSRYKGMKSLVLKGKDQKIENIIDGLNRIGIKTSLGNFNEEALSIDLKENDVVFIKHDFIRKDDILLIMRLRELLDNKPIIMLASYDWTNNIDEAKKAGVTLFCEKPGFTSSIIDALNECFGYEKKNNSINIYDCIINKRALIVDDNDANLIIAEVILNSKGIKTETAINGEDAIKKLEKSKIGYYDIVLMDVQMPILDGYETTKIIRNSKRLDIANIPILAMTADSFQSDIEEAINCGMNGHLSKPLDFSKMLEVMSKIFLK